MVLVWEKPTPGSFEVHIWKRGVCRFLYFKMALKQSKIQANEGEVINYHNAHIFQKWKAASFMWPGHRYSALFQSSSEASLDKDQYSEREARSGRPSIFSSTWVWAWHSVCMCNAGPSLPSAPLRMLRLHGNPTYWTDEKSTQIRPRWSNGWNQAQRESARGYVSAATRMLRCVLTTPTWPTGYSVGQTEKLLRYNAPVLEGLKKTSRIVELVKAQNSILCPGAEQAQVRWRRLEVQKDTERPGRDGWKATLH